MQLSKWKVIIINTYNSEKKIIEEFWKGRHEKQSGYSF